MLDYFFPDLSTRTTSEKEMLELPELDPEQLRRTVQQFRLINSLLSGSQRLMRRHFFPMMAAEPDRSYTMLDVGAGGCDIAIGAATEARRRGLKLSITALDNDRRTLALARRAIRDYPEIRLVEGNALELRGLGPFDFVFSNHLLHHLEWGEIKLFLEQVVARTRLCLLMNDLKRSHWAYLGFTIFSALLTRRNIGLDFGAWRMALRALSLPRPDTNRILLINDSVYGPLLPLAPLLARMPANGADLWGLTDSQERGWHLQSYFLLAGPTLIRSPIWRSFWRGVVPLPFKRWTVGRYEVGLSQRVLKAGFSARALFPHTSVANPTLGEWRALLEAGFPFLKRELLRDNPTGVENLDSWRDLVPPARAAEIDADLRRR